MQYMRDAGGCCGLYIAAGFGARYTEAVERELDRLMEERALDVANRNPGRLVDGRADRGRVANVLTQATLTDQQMNNGWAEVLHRKGWNLVSRFYNSNSGNYVNVLHYSDTRESRANADMPFNWPKRQKAAGGVRRAARRAA